MFDIIHKRHARKHEERRETGREEGRNIAKWLVSISLNTQEPHGVLGVVNMEMLAAFRPGERDNQTRLPHIWGPTLEISNSGGPRQGFFTSLKEKKKKLEKITMKKKNENHKSSTNTGNKNLFPPHAQT